MIQTHTRRVMVVLSFCAVLFAGPTGGRGATGTNQIECWDIFEITLAGPSSGNPFVDVHLSAQFGQGDRAFTPEGFYDGDGVYRIRFMPDAPGSWTYVTKSDCEELDGKKGEFTCVAAAPGNHGPVRVHNTFQLAYADGTPHFSVGTTCYAWAHQGDAMEEQTLATLKDAPFNKTLQSAGLDRQFRGQIRGLQIYASRIGARSVLPLEKIRERQKDK